jgi:hypothetical protein
MNSTQKEWQEAFHRAINNLDTDKMMNALKNGAQINNKYCKKNTVNCAIRTLLNNSTKRFNLKFIKDLIDAGAQINNQKTSNIMSIIMEYTTPYIESSKRRGEEENALNNIIELIEFIISRINNNKLPDDILSNAIKTGNEKIVKLIMDQKPKIYTNTMTLAVKTKNVNIINIMSDNDVAPDNSCNDKNTLTTAVLTNQPEIVYEVLIAGALPNNKVQVNNIYYSYSGSVTTFESYYYNVSYKNDSKTIDQMINLLMCSGAEVPYSLYNRSSNRIVKKKIDRKIIDCYDLQNHTNDSKRFKKLKFYLIDTMNYLSGSQTYKTLMIKEIEEIVPCIPTVCINIIYDYQQNKSKVKFIDWTKY